MHVYVLCKQWLMHRAREGLEGVLPPRGRSINIRSQVLPLSKGVLRGR